MTFIKSLFEVASQLQQQPTLTPTLETASQVTNLFNDATEQVADVADQVGELSNRVMALESTNAALSAELALAAERIRSGVATPADLEHLRESLHNSQAALCNNCCWDKMLLELLKWAIEKLGEIIANLDLSSEELLNILVVASAVSLYLDSRREIKFCAGLIIAVRIGFLIKDL